MGQKINHTQYGEIVEQDLNSSNGYIRYANGWQKAWKTVTKPSSAMGSWGSVYYTEVNAGNWAKPFSSVAIVSCSGLNAFDDGWVSCRGITTTSAGDVRFYRPTSTTAAVSAVVSAEGEWS